MIRLVSVLALLIVAACSQQSATVTVQREIRCPTKEDLETGIQLTRTEPLFSSLLRQTPSGLIETRQMSRNGELIEVVTTYPHALVSETRKTPGEEMVLRHAADIQLLDNLDGHQVWTSVVELILNGSAFATGTTTKRLIATGTIAVDGCSYKAWQVLDETSFSGEIATSAYRFYAPDLGLVLRVVTLDPDKNPESLIAFDKISIEGAQ